MILFNKDKIHEFFFLFHVKMLWFLAVYYFVKAPKLCTGFQRVNEEIEIGRETRNLSLFGSESPGTSQSCQYFRPSKRLICKGSINSTFLKEFQNEHINDLIIENYEADSQYRQKYWSRRSVETGEWYMKVPKLYRHLNGEILLKDTGVQINVILNILPRANADGFLIKGEAFSNKVIKVSWRLNGNLSLKLVQNTTVILLDVSSSDESDWRLQSNLTFERRNPDNEFDEWKVFGLIKPSDALESDFVFYKGMVGTTIIKEECNFVGEVKIKSSNLVGLVSGNAAPPQNRQITIPRSAFSNLTIKNIIFKDSNFYKDFERNSLNGLKGVESVTFTNSKLKDMPRLDELFKSLIDLEEIYIEDCTTVRLKFGSLSTLRKVRRLSFKGSGPLEFDELSFVWLNNSNLTFLDLQNSHVKVSSKTKSLLWSVKDSLKHLDISHSTINEEKDLLLILNGLNIVTLEAAGLKLSKVPTEALSSVRKSLEYLSLKRNNFKKTFEKIIFLNVLNFPLMVNLKELNLEDCRINYIETGTFDNLPNLKIIHLAHNNIENLQDGWTFIKPKIVYMSLMHNGRTTPVPSTVPYDLETSINLNSFTKLEVLDLSNGIFTNVNKIVASLGSSVRILSLRNTGFEDLSKNTFQNLTNLEKLDLSYNKNLNTTLSFPLLKSFKRLTLLDLKQCRIGATSFYDNGKLGSRNSSDILLESLEYLDLSFNNIKILDPRKLSAFPKLRILNLSGNSISGWKPSLHGSNKKLQAVFLDENKIETLTNEMLSDVKTLKTVKLGNNPFICGSYVYEFRKIIQEFTGKDTGSEQSKMFYENVLEDGTEKAETEGELDPFTDIIYSNWRKNQLVQNRNGKVLDWSEQNYYCFSWSRAKFIPFTEVAERFESFPVEKTGAEEVTLLWITLVVVVGIVITIAIICWKFLDVHLLTRAIRNAVALSFLSRGEKEPANYKYNVFVSYSDRDRPWVIENLLPRLESRSDIKVCLHERDFQVGLSILENIINSIDSSKNIILIVSQAFLKSQWCLYELHLAQHRLLEKGRDNLVLVFLENIPSVKRLKTLKYLMMTKTYIEWPANPKSAKEVDAFWSRLMSSLVNVN